jgi:N-acetylglutamate synthase-like GNAT family acetyltransferase
MKQFNEGSPLDARGAMGGESEIMETLTSSQGYTLRQADAKDAETIRQIISQVHINPTGLNWQRFILAVDQMDKIIGCGQIKPHGDGSLELASIAVLPEWRDKGVARSIIEHLLEQHHGKLYLTCRAQLGPLYQKFGFQVISTAEMPTYFKRVSGLVNLVPRLRHQPDRLFVMRRN